MGRNPLNLFKKGAFSRKTWMRAAAGAALGVAAAMGAGFAANHSDKIENIVRAQFTNAAKTDETPATPETNMRQQIEITGGYKHPLPQAVTGADGHLFQPPPRATEYFAPTTVNGCTTGARPVRLTFQMGIIDDPAQTQDSTQNDTQNRAAQLSWMVADLWKDATRQIAPDFSLNNADHRAVMKDFLDYASVYIFKQTGVRIALKISPERAINFADPARADEYSTCRAEGEAAIPAPRTLPLTGQHGTQKPAPLLRP